MTTVRQASFVAPVLAAAVLGITLTAGSSEDTTALLETERHAAQQVYVQLGSDRPELGNALISAQLTSDQVEQKQREGTADFITLGKDQEILLRDDGQKPDEIAHDGLYTTYAYIDPDLLFDRARQDEDVASREGFKDFPIFGGRTIIRYEKQQPFDYAGFSSGKRVPLDLAMVELEPEDSQPVPQPQGNTGAITSTFAAAIPPPPPMTLPNPTPSPGFTNLFQERVLLIRNPAVVQDPGRTYDPCTNTGAPAGVWTFHHLMAEMANKKASGIDPALFVERWLQTWTVDQPVNSFNVPPRNQINQILNQWPRTTNGRLDLNRSPLRLLAILNRTDLRRSTGGGGYSGGSSGNFIDAGELRFIFGFVLPPGWSDTGFLGVVSIDGASCRAIPFTVIFEYEVPACGCNDVKEWAQEWVKLRQLNPVNADYRKHLQRLTQQVVRANVDPNNPNGSTLRTLRTNEVALASPWELREFQLTQNKFSMINETTADDTPHDSFFNTQVLRSWITTIIQPKLTQAQLFENAAPPVQLFFSNVNFLGANPRMPHPPAIPPTMAPFTFFWTAPNLNNLSANGGMNTQNWARHRVSRASCSGCHRRETNTPFVHVDNANGAQPVPPVPISGFLSGINNVRDPAEAGGLPVRHFDDLLRRETDIKQVASANCFPVHPINKDHVLEALEKTGALPADLFAGLEVPLNKRPTIAAEELQNMAPAAEVH
ncbi:MAG TPA: hypothetical protein VN493_31110 [Thermoanaerobaculia bacterium]|nr:hypothetical protein [Thermoanaerobaculia bacterium]